MRRVHQDGAARSEQLMLDLDEIARQGAQRMLAHALQAARLMLTTFGQPKESATSTQGTPWSSGTATTTVVAG